MAKKKKVNPYNVPIDPRSVDVDALITEATVNNVLHGWLLFLGSLSYYYETTTKSILHIWQEVNEYSQVFAEDNPSVDYHMETVERVLGLSDPYKMISASGIKTLGDLNKFKNRLHKKGLYAVFSLIAYPLIVKKILEESIIRDVFHRAYELDEDILEKRISFRDLQWVLVDEYHILLCADGADARLDEVGDDFDFEKFCERND